VAIISDTFPTNPQYHIIIDEVDDSGNNNNNKNNINKATTCTLLVALTQRERRSSGTDLLEIGYAIYKVNQPTFR